jgi:hypothetical protein
VPGGGIAARFAQQRLAGPEIGTVEAGITGAFGNQTLAVANCPRWAGLSRVT